MPCFPRSAGPAFSLPAPPLLLAQGYHTFFVFAVLAWLFYLRPKVDRFARSSSRLPLALKRRHLPAVTMDVPDVSEDEIWAASMRQLEDLTLKAKAKKGQTPRLHMPAYPQIMSFMATRAATLQQSAMPDQHRLISSYLPAAYPPCILSVPDLMPIAIAEMKLETHHRGRRALVRIMTPPNRMNAIMAIVEDEYGTATLLQIYNQPPESDVPADEIMRMNRVAIIKEPFFKSSPSENTYSLRVDHVSDIVWLDGDDSRIPPKWRLPSSRQGSQDLRNKGNDAVKRKCFAEAERLYSSAVLAAKTPDEKSLAVLNRSHANLKLGRLEDALSDAALASQLQAPSEKGLFREARALYELRRFSESLAKLEELSAKYPNNGAVKPEIKRTKARLHEQNTGDYSFAHMHEQAKATPPIIDCATFAGLVEVRPSPGRGRGLFVTKRVAAGQLLLCEKAFGYSFVDDSEMAGQGSSTTVLMDLSTHRASAGGQASLIPQVVQRLYSNPQSSHAFGELHKGDYQSTVEPELILDGKPVVDTFHVSKIITQNSFGAGRSTWDMHQRMMNGKSFKNKFNHTCGVWVKASYINHSCLENCHRSFIGDMQIVRAVKDLEAGTELVFGYDRDNVSSTYSEKQKKLSSWGFTCECALCTEKKSIPAAKLATMKTLRLRLVKLTQVPDPRRFKGRVSEALRILERLEAFLPTTPTALRLDLWEPYLAIGAAFKKSGQPQEAIRYVKKALESMGFVIHARLPSNSTPNQRPTLLVKQWGQVEPDLGVAFMILNDSFQEIAPDLCVLMEKYMETAHAIVNGDAWSLKAGFRGT